jgi:hypothetical protein
MHEEPRDSTRPGVEVFVGAPHGEVDVPSVQRKESIPNGVSEVPTNCATLWTSQMELFERKRTSVPSPSPSS